MLSLNSSTTQDHMPRGLDLPMLNVNKKMPPIDMPTGQSDGSNSPTEGPSF